MKYRRGKGWAAIEDKNVVYLLDDGPDVWIDLPKSLKARWKRAIRNPWFWAAVGLMLPWLAVWWLP